MSKPISSSMNGMFNRLYFMGYCHFISYWEKKDDYNNNPETKVTIQRMALKEATLFPSLPIMVPALLLSLYLMLAYVENPKLPMIFSTLAVMGSITFIFRKIYVTDTFAENVLKRYKNTSKGARKRYKRMVLSFYIIMGLIFIASILAGGRFASILFR